MIYEVGIIKKLRKLQGLTQQELAKKCDMQQFEIARLENSLDMSLNKFMKVAKALGVTILIL
jgi:transcriptional regulator with XRE-family HTH domain